MTNETPDSKQPVVDQVEDTITKRIFNNSAGERIETIVRRVVKEVEGLDQSIKTKIKTMKKTTIILAVVLALSVALNIVMFVRNAVSAQDKQYIQQLHAQAWTDYQSKLK